MQFQKDGHRESWCRHNPHVSCCRFGHPARHTQGGFVPAPNTVVTLASVSAQPVYGKRVAMKRVEWINYDEGILVPVAYAIYRLIVVFTGRMSLFCTT